MPFRFRDLNRSTERTPFTPRFQPAFQRQLGATDVSIRAVSVGIMAYCLGVNIAASLNGPLLRADELELGVPGESARDDLP